MRVLKATPLVCLGLLPCRTLAHPKADSDHHCDGQQAHHQHRGQLLTKAEVGSQSRQSQSCGDTGQRAHPGARRRGSRRARSRCRRWRGCGRRFIGRCLALRAHGLAGAHAFGGFSVHGDSGETEAKNHGHESE